MSGVSREYRHKSYHSPYSLTGLFFLSLQVYIIMFAGAYLFFHFIKQPYMQISLVRIEGTKTVDSSGISEIVRQELEKRTLFFIPRNNVIFFPRSAIKTRIFENSSSIKEVQFKIERKTGTIVVHEYNPTYLYCPVSNNTMIEKAEDGALGIKAPEKQEGEKFNEDSDNNALQNHTEEIPFPQFNSPICYWADTVGYIYGRAPYFRGSPVFEIVDMRNDTLLSSYVGTSISPLEIISYQKSIGTLLGERGLLLKKMTLHSDGDVEMSFGYPWIVLTNTKRSASESADHLLLSLKELGPVMFGRENTIKTIDLRFGNKVFYK